MMRMTVLTALMLVAGPVASKAPPLQAERSEVVAKVWAGQWVGFAMQVFRGRIYIGYYGADRRLVVASRNISGGRWDRRTLDTAVGWDSHNYVTLATDDQGRLHVAANMHVSPLTYYMSDATGSVQSLRRVPSLVSAPEETRVTYPTFINDQQGRLIFRYRDGMSGNGNEIYDVFDARTQQWRRLTPKPVLDGEGKRNAYPVGPTLGPDGWFHMVWVWREQPAAEATHDLSYGRSRDLIHWTTSTGAPLTLPIRLATSEIVDPVPVHGGIINGNTPFGFDARKRVMIAYHKFDAQGNTQVYLARHESQGWHIAQASQWTDYRWDFRGGGTLSGDLVLAQPYQRGNFIVLPIARQGKGMQLRLDATTLAVTNAPLPPAASAATPGWTPIKPPPGMKMNVLTGEGGGKSFRLVWTTLPNNRDQPRSDVPAPTDLQLFERPSSKNN